LAVALDAVPKAAFTAMFAPFVYRFTGPVGPLNATAPPTVMLPVCTVLPIVRVPDVLIAFKSAASRLKSPPTVAPRLMPLLPVDGWIVTAALPPVRLPPLRLIVSPVRLTAFAVPPLLTAPDIVRRFVTEPRLIVPLAVTPAM